MSVTEFWNLSWWECDCMLHAHQTKEELEWRRTRQILSMIYNVNVTKKHHLKKPEEILPLPSDVEIRKTKYNREQYNAMYKQMLDLHNKYKSKWQS